ncbi:MAG TPA: hypothetical protein VKV17_20405 [Bryobacteraceae bacterium]|nr:hypothetical protein [Bryobacteraceae bacterium]
MNWRRSFLAAALLAAVPLFAQGPPAGGPGGRGGGRGFGRGRGPNLPPPGPVPRTADGRPDMSGYWNAGQNGGAVFEVQKHEARSRSLPAGQGAIVDPPDGLIPYQPWAAAKAKDNFEHHLADEPELHCFESGLPNQMYRQFGFQILEPAGYIVMNWEFMHAYRIIPTDNRTHTLPASVKLFQGDSVGHWEGDTFVVDTTNFNDRTWLDSAGNIHTDQMHVVERFTMVNDRTIDYEATIEDPKAYTRPWKIAFAFNRNMQPGYETMEFACIEGNTDLQHYQADEGGKQP